MGDFTPSADFTARTMQSVRKLESRCDDRKRRLRALLYSKAGLVALSAVGALFGIIHCIGLASILVFPAVCR